MVPTFLLTRTFAISGMLVGAQLACAAPTPYLGACGQGCMFKEPDAPASDAAVASPSAVSSFVGPTPSAVAEIIRVIEVISPVPDTSPPPIPVIDVLEIPPEVDDDDVDPTSLSDIIGNAARYAQELQKKPQ